MFLKKPSNSKLPSIDSKSMREEIIKRDLNHEFFLLVREQKYQEAHSLGMLYLQYNQNPSIRKFCSFIETNRAQLLKMVQEELEYTDEESSQEDGQDDSEEEEDKKSVISKASSSSKSSIAHSVSSKLSLSSGKQSAGKQNSTKCIAHTWNHNCRNKDCPNRKKC